MSLFMMKKVKNSEIHHAILRVCRS